MKPRRQADFTAFVRFFDHIGSRPQSLTKGDDQGEVISQFVEWLQIAPQAHECRCAGLSMTGIKPVPSRSRFTGSSKRRRGASSWNSYHRLHTS